MLVAGYPDGRLADADRPILRGIDRLVLRVENVPAAVRYYRESLGLDVVREGERYATLRLGDGRELLLHNDPDLPAEAVFLLVDDVNDLYRRREELRLRFAGPPGRVSRGYKATAKDPFGTVLLLIDRTLAEKSGQATEDAASPEALFPGVAPRITPRRELLAGLYERVGRTADDLPYTPQFEQIHGEYAAAFVEPRPDRAETWRHLLLLRKGGNLPKLGAARSRPPALDEEATETLRRIALEELGEGLGRRDRLPYTAGFDRLAERFNGWLNRTGRPPLAPHLLWRALATVAK